MRLAIVGCGDAAQTIVLASRFLRGVRVSCVVDRDPERRERFARRLRCEARADWRDLIGSDACDAVYIAIPHDAHEEVTSACVDAALPALLEKPIAATVDAGERMVGSLGPDSRVAVNYQYRYDPRAWRVVESVRGGVIGPVRYATVELPWYRGPDYFAAASWHASRARSGGGTLLTQGSHLLDLALHACGDPRLAIGRTFRRVHSASDVEDLALGVVETTDGVPIQVLSSMVTSPSRPAGIRFVGERGTIEWHGPSRSRITARGVRVRRPVVWTELHAYVASLAAFQRWVAGGPAPRCEANGALPVLRAVDALYRSALEGRAVEIGQR